MSARVDRMFEKVLLREMDEDDVFRTRAGDFEAGLDAESNPEDFEVDGLGFDATAKQEDDFINAYEKVQTLQNIIAELIDPDVNSLLKILSELDRNDSIAKGAVERVNRDAKKISDSASSIIHELMSIASREVSLSRKIKAINGN